MFHSVRPEQGSSRWLRALIARSNKWNLRQQQSLYSLTEAPLQQGKVGSTVGYWWVRGDIL